MARNAKKVLAIGINVVLSDMSKGVVKGISGNQVTVVVDGEDRVIDLAHDNIINDNGGEYSQESF